MPRSPLCRTWDRRTRPSIGRGPPCWGWRTGWGSPAASWWSCSRAAPGRPAGTGPARCPHTCEERTRYVLSFLSEVILWNWQFNLEDNSIYLLQREKIKSQEEINSPGYRMVSFTIEVIGWCSTSGSWARGPWSGWGRRRGRRARGRPGWRRTPRTQWRTAWHTCGHMVMVSWSAHQMCTTKIWETLMST